MSTGSESIPPPNDVSPVLPEKFLGLFRPRRCGGDLDSSLPDTFKVTLNLSDLDLSPPVDPMPLGVKAGVQVFHDEAVALYTNPAGDPINLTALNDLVAQLAEDFYWWQNNSLDYVYIGISGVAPVALYDYIEFSYDDNVPAADDNQDDQIVELVEDRMRPNCYTRVASEPWNGYPEQFQHWDQDNFTGPCVDGSDRTPGILMLVPGASSGGATGPIKLAASVLTLEDGRLVKTYDKPDLITCGCSTTPPCGQVCVTLTGCGDLGGITVTAQTQPIDHVTITNGGTGYTSAPTVTFSITNGNSGAGTAVLDGSGHVASITITNGGAYIGPVTITFNNSGHGGTGAAGTVVLGTSTTVNTCVIAGTVTGISVSNAGSGYSVIAPLVLTGGGGAGVVTVVSMRLVVGAITLIAGGSGYAVNQVINLVGGTFTAVANIRVTAVAAGTGAITAASIQTLGSYQALPANPVSIAGGTAGTGALFSFLWGVSGVTVTDGGIGFTSAPTVTFDDPGSTGGVRATGASAFAYKCCLGVFISGKYNISTDACTPAATPVTVTCPTNTNVTIAAAGTAILRYVPCGACPGLSISGSTWTVSGMGCVRSVTFVNNPGLVNCDISFSISRPGSYTITGPVSACYQTNSTQVISALCSGTVYTPTLISKTYNQTFHISGCNGLSLAGATVTLSGSFYSGSRTTDSLGNATFVAVPADCDFTLTIAYSRFVTFGPLTWHSPCSDGTSNFALNTPIANYVCTNCVAYPLPMTLFGVDSEGAFTLTYQPVFGYWAGCHMATGKTIVCVGNTTNCRAGTSDPFGNVTIFSNGSAAIGWTFNGGGNSSNCGISSSVPGMIDSNDPGGGKYYPIQGCCANDYQANGGAGYDSSAICGGTAGTCTPGLPRPVGVGLGGGCGAGPNGVLVGGYPTLPPFSATWSLALSPTDMNFPHGTVTVSE